MLFFVEERCMITQLMFVYFQRLTTNRLLRRPLPRSSQAKSRRSRSSASPFSVSPIPSDVLTPSREYGSKVVGEITLDQVYGGARGIKSLVWEVGAGKSYIEAMNIDGCYRARFSILRRVSASVERL